jgi:two-component system CheB/CheR fusion protein
MQWLLLKEYAPASLLVDDGGQILYFYGATLPYLDLPSGEPTHNLLEMARDGLRNKLRTAIRKASKDQRPVTVQTRMKGNGRSYSLVRASVKPVQMPNYPETLLLVSFQVEREPPPSLPNDMIGDSLVRQLESELKESREELSSTIHDLQGSIEDLKSSNEEVMSMNEELQSSNEELETSKEELQSLNEELSTVNSQLYSKIDELEQVTNDITNLLDNTGIPTLFLDTHFCLRRFTPSATQILKLIAADIGRPLTDIASTVPDPDVLRDAAKVLRSENSIEKALPGPAGQWWIRRISPYRGTNSQVEGVVITFIDVTGVKIANERMNRLTAVLMDSNDAITVRDLAGNISGWSHGAELMYGYTEEEALELNFLQLVPEELRTSEFAALEHLRESGRTDTREAQRVRRDGSVLDVWLTTTRLRNQNDGSVSFATIERDLTERKRMEQMRVARDSAQEATRIKSQFLAHMSHEIRTPLHGVMGTLSLLLDTELTAEQRAIAMMACDSAQFLLKVIEDILDFSRIEAGKLQLTSAPVDLRKIVHRVISVLRVIADEKNLELTHSIDPGLPILVRSDEFRLSQILTNLIANAIKFTERGSVRLDVSEVTAAPGTALLVSLPYLGQADGYWIEFSVRDTGIGIQEELLAELFQSFSQVDGTISRKYGGTGLGLAISKQLVEMMGGEIGVESQIRVGSRFWFRVQLDAPSRAETIT